MIHSKCLTSLVCFIFLTCGLLKAGVETSGSRIAGSQIVPSVALSAKDNNPQPINFARIASSTGSVIFSVDKASNVFVASAYTVRLGLQITSFDINGSFNHWWLCWSATYIRRT